METKVCTKCHVSRGIDEFKMKVKCGKATNERNKQCNTCRKHDLDYQQSEKGKQIRKENREKHIEQKLSYDREWKEKNAEYIKEYGKHYREENKSKLAQKHNKYWHDVAKEKRKHDLDCKIRSKINHYKKQDKRKNRACDLDVDYVKILLTNVQFVCHWCKCECKKVGFEPQDSKQWTLDRLDDTKGHMKDNIVVSCLRCNILRGFTKEYA